MTGPKDEQTLDIARRTRKNLEFIYNAKRKEEEVEEFTQLLNSMLGMVISLREDYFKGDSVTWDEVKNLGLKSWDPRLEINGKRASSTSPKLQQTNSFSQLVTRLRNAFAHNCFDLIMAEDKDLITGITVWNIPTGKTNQLNRIWEADILESELKGLAYLFVEYLEKVFDL